MVSLRNLQRVVAASNFAARTHSFLFANYGKTFAPASLYFSPQDTSLAPDTVHDPFTLSLLASELTRENRLLSQKLGSLSSVETAGLRSEIERRINDNTAYIQSYTKELVSQIQSQSFEFPVETVGNTIYALEHNNQSQRQLYQTLLFPVLREKLDYLSLAGLARLLNGLVKAGLTGEKEVLSGVLTRLRRKLTEGKDRKLVGFNAWRLDRYELVEKKGGSGGGIQGLKEGSGFAGALKDWLLENWSLVQNFLVYRLLYREARVRREFEEAGEEEVLAGLRQDLGQLKEAGVNVEELLSFLGK